MNRTVAKINHFKWIFICLTILLMAGALFVGLSRQVKADSTIQVSDDTEFLDAFKDAEEGDIIQLTEPITLEMNEDWISAGDKTIVIDKDITLDCNGYELTLKKMLTGEVGSVFVEAFLFRITDDGKLTLKNTQIVQKNGSFWGTYDENKIRLVLIEENRGEFEIKHTSGDGSEPDCLKIDHLVVTNNGKIVIEGGNFVTFWHSIRINNDDITVKGGQFRTDGEFLHTNDTKGKLKVVGGSFDIRNHPEAIEFISTGNLVFVNRGAIEIQAGDFESENHFFYHSYEAGQLLIRDGTFTSNNYFMEFNEGEMIVEGGVFNSVGSLIDYIPDEGRLIVCGGEFNISSDPGEPKAHVSFIPENAGMVEIREGEFNLDRYFIFENRKNPEDPNEMGRILITGGTFNCGDWFMAINDGKVDIKGGTFNSIGTLIVQNGEDASLLVEDGDFNVKRIPEFDPDDHDPEDIGFFSVYNLGSMTVRGGQYVLEDGGLLIFNDGTVLVEDGEFDTAMSFFGLNLKDAEIQILGGDFTVLELDNHEPLDDADRGNFIWQNGGSLQVDAGDFTLDCVLVFSNRLEPGDADIDPSIGNVHIKDATIKSEGLVFELAAGSDFVIDTCDFRGESYLVFESWGELLIKGGTYWVEDGPMIQRLLANDEGDSDTRISGGRFSSNYEGDGGVIYLEGGQLVLTGGRFENRSKKSALFVDREKNPVPTLSIPNPYVAYP